MSWIRPWTITTMDSDFSNELQNILDEKFNSEHPKAIECPVLHISEQWKFCIPDRH